LGKEDPSLPKKVHAGKGRWSKRGRPIERVPRVERAMAGENAVGSVKKLGKENVSENLLEKGELSGDTITDRRKGKKDKFGGVLKSLQDGI